MSNQSSYVRPSTTTTENHDSPKEPQPPISGITNLTTCLYHTDLGLFSLTWSRAILGRSLDLNLHPHLHPFDSTTFSPFSLSLSTLPSLSPPSFHLHIKPFIFWKKHGSKKLTITNLTTTVSIPKIQIFWDLTRAKFGSRPEPQSGFYIAVVVDGEMTLLVGDSKKEAYSKTKAKKPERTAAIVLRREHVFGNKIYNTKARFGGKNREISIECNVKDGAKLCFSVDNKRVLQIKHLKWKFRGNERIEVDGMPIQVSWDVYNWLFEDVHNGHAVFMFRFEEAEEDGEVCHGKSEKNGIVLWRQQSFSFGMNEIEWKKMKRKSLLRTARSSSSSSISSASSGCSSSVMEWASMEDSELNGTSGFSLVVYAWKR